MIYIYISKKKILFLLLFIIQVYLLNSLTLAEEPKNYLKGKFYNSVENHFLIATKKMIDNRFEKSVIIMLQSDDKGAWGLAINKQIGFMPIALLIDPSLNTSEEREKLYSINIPVFWGGPVEKKKIFIIHSKEYKSDSTESFGKISISQDYKILIDIAENKGPKKSLVVLGYSGWGEGQLEGEMEKGHWFLSDVDLSIIFDQMPNNKWEKIYESSFIKI